MKNKQERYSITKDEILHMIDTITQAREKFVLYEKNQLSMANKVIDTMDNALENIYDTLLEYIGK